jgi:PTH1 family peptidyl-tRNA hydrolase
MKLIVGLGNPGKEYEQTRHNAGFLVIDELARRLGAEFCTKKACNAELVEARHGSEKILFVKPQTFMNLSGDTVRAIRANNDLEPKDILVVLDEADIPFGELRMRPGGGSAGHNGMKSIMALFPAGTEIPRLRIGIGRSPNPEMPLDAWVLNKWSKEEAEKLPTIISKAADEVEAWMSSPAETV